MTHNYTQMAHHDKGAIDLGKLKQRTDYTRADLEEFVYRLKRHGYGGKEYGSKEIYKEQVRLFKPTGSNGGLLSRPTIERRINDSKNKDTKDWNPIRYAPAELDYSVDAVPRQWIDYVARLSMISEFLWDRPLTGSEAEVAERVGGGFNDPFGEQVDLIPQLAMVREYVSRHLYTAERNATEIFDLYFTYAPWKYGLPFYLKQLEPKAHGIPMMTDFMLFASESEGWKEESPVLDDAFRQLGLNLSGYGMEWHFYWDLEKDSMANIVGGFVPDDESKGKCNWMKILESDDNTRDKWAEIRRVPAEVTK